MKHRKYKNIIVRLFYSLKTKIKRQYQIDVNFYFYLILWLTGSQLRIH